MVNGIVAGSHVNVHAIEAVGKTIIRDIIGKSFFGYKFTRKCRAKSLGIARRLRSLLTVLFIMLFCSSVFWSCQNMEILPLLSSLKPRTYFVQQISLRSLRQFESML
ncbi:hypothetical protein DPMN_069337 [Dreissena polymorpha]|uniref:Uncharacterized protein n=1 Tax=Dreissena polymorpha TaxID=45954 RepID=A0A9D3Z3X3_DREPO|nr:hypothetical protein DPMN_069337 [Dreissena polymorpha]